MKSQKKVSKRCDLKVQKELLLGKKAECEGCEEGGCDDLHRGEEGGELRDCC